ncbi:MAG: NAD-dependent protein deacetylase [Pseudomonadales bacterium]|nr:NAD-dependent protein deacetylase [Pseudomonadales bacterium]
MVIRFPPAPEAATHEDLGEALASFRSFLAEHERLVVLTGAGCSTDSGIPAYRDADGSWRQRRPVQYQDFVSDPYWRRRYWARSLQGFPLMAGAPPNAAHRWLVDFARAGRIELLITQNVDGLHQRAGSEGVVELHGSIHRVVCLNCGDVSRRSDMQARLELANPGHRGVSTEIRPDGDADLRDSDLEAFAVPACTRCAGMLKPDVVFFGEAVPKARVERCYAALERADALLVLGSSLMVYSGFRFPRRMAELGKPMASVTRGRTRADDLLNLRLRVGVVELFEALEAR